MGSCRNLSLICIERGIPKLKKDTIASQLKVDLLCTFCRRLFQRVYSRSTQCRCFYYFILTFLCAPLIDRNFTCMGIFSSPAYLQIKWNLQFPFTLFAEFLDQFLLLLLSWLCFIIIFFLVFVLLLLLVFFYLHH